MRLLLTIALFLSVAQAGAAEPAAKPAEPDGYGLSKAQAIEVCKPGGEHAYLARLVCPNREHPHYERSGSVGERVPLPDDFDANGSNRLVEAMLGYQALKPGETDHHVVDRYEVSCGETKTSVYLDMYHCQASRPTAAPPGFTLID